MKQYSIIGYHATDSNNVDDIIKNDFTFRRNKKHWLGNGIYFYLDPSLAKWWATNPSKVFGDPIKNSSIIKCVFKISDERFVNLRKLDHYNFFIKAYNEYLQELTVKGTAKPNDINVLRCSVCDYIANTYNIQAILGVFNMFKQPYLHPNYMNTYKELKLLYPETQLCVFDQSIIEKKEVV